MMGGIEEYEGYLMDTDNDHNVVVLTKDFKVLYPTGRRGNAKAYIDGRNAMEKEMKEQKQTVEKK